MSKLKRKLPQPKGPKGKWDEFELNFIRLDENPHIYYSRINSQTNEVNPNYALGSDFLLEKYNDPKLEDIFAEISGYEQTNQKPEFENTKSEQQIKNIKLKLNDLGNDVDLEIEHVSGSAPGQQIVTQRLSGVLSENPNPSLGSIKNKLNS